MLTRVGWTRSPKIPKTITGVTEVAKLNTKRLPTLAVTKDGSEYVLKSSRNERELTKEKEFTETLLGDTFPVQEQSKVYSFLQRRISGTSLDKVTFNIQSMQLTIISNLLNEIQRIHSQNYIHRDIKPQNIIVGTNGDVKLIDYGYTEKLPDGQYDHNNIDSPIQTHFPGTETYICKRLMKELQDYDFTKTTLFKNVYKYAPSDRTKQIKKQQDLYALAKTIKESFTLSPGPFEDCITQILMFETAMIDFPVSTIDKLLALFEEQKELQEQRLLHPNSEEL